MAGTKRIMVSVPNQLLQEVDGIMKKDRVNRSELFRQAIKFYISERKKLFIRETMQRGYVEMGNINLQLSSEAFSAEQDADHAVGRLVKGV